MGLDPDLVLRDREAGSARDDRDDGPDDVRRLAGHVQGQVAVDGIPVGDHAARLDAGDVDARQIDVLLDAQRGALERRICRGAVA